MERALFVAASMAALVVIMGGRPTAPTSEPTETIAPPTPRATVVDVLEVPVFGAADGAPLATPTPARTIDGARIVIARLGIDLALAWGDIARDVPRDAFPGATPEDVALVFPGSALPGTGGNTFIYSHARTDMFLSLWGAKRGDLIVLAWPDRYERRYVVERVVPRVDPSDASWLGPGGPERLTLQTSTGPRASDPRFIVVATPFEAGP